MLSVVGYEYWSRLTEFGFSCAHVSSDGQGGLPGGERRAHHPDVLTNLRTYGWLRSFVQALARDGSTWGALSRRRQALAAFVDCAVPLMEPATFLAGEATDSEKSMMYLTVLGQ
jgi:hypothetical protein